VSVFCTLEAEVLPTVTEDIYLSLRRVLDTSVALRGRAPFDLFVDVHKAFLEKGLVSFEFLVRKKALVEPL
jgi:hypothetical protein